MNIKISKEFKTGIVVILTILAFWWLFNFLKGKDLFTSKQMYYVKYNNVEGLLPTKSVFINGMKVGIIESITPIFIKDSVNFVVKLAVDKSYPITKTTISEIYESGFLGGPDIRLIIDYKGKPAVSGDTLKGRINTSIVTTLMNEITPLKDNANNALTKLDQTLTSANNVLDNNNQQQIRLLLVSLNRTVSSLNDLANNTNKVVTANQNEINGMLTNANKAMGGANQAMTKYSAFADNLNQLELNKTLKNLDNDLSEINKLLAKINSGEGSIGQLINNKSLYNNLNSTLTSLNSLITDLQANPKNYINISVFGKSNKPKTTAPLLKVEDFDNQKVEIIKP